MRADEPLARIMTETVVVVDVHQPVSVALECFRQYRIHHLPVVREGRLAGMLSTADLLKLEHFAPKHLADRATYLDQHVTLEQLMRTPVTSLPPTASIAEAADRFAEAGVHAVPVVDDAGHVLGIVTTSDIIASLMRGPPRRGGPAESVPATREADDQDEMAAEVQPRPTRDEFGLALRSARALVADDRDPRCLGKSLLYLDQRRALLEKVAALAERLLHAGQDEAVHAQLLKALHAARRAEERAAGRTAREAQTVE